MGTIDKIKQLRKEKNMTQSDLSLKSGIPLSSIKQYESGARNPKFATIQKIASVLDTNAYELMIDDDIHDRIVSSIAKLTTLSREIEDTSNNISSFGSLFNEYISNDNTMLRNNSFLLWLTALNCEIKLDDNITMDDFDIISNSDELKTFLEYLIHKYVNTSSKEGE